jgi:nitrous oxidase accessory protein
MHRRRAAIALTAALFWGAAPAAVCAKTIDVAPGDGLIQAVAAAAAGDVLHLAPGDHKGPITIEKPLTLEGDGFDKTSVTGDGTGSVIKILAPDVTVRGLRITGSTKTSDGTEGGIYVEKGADNPVIEDNWLDHNLFGISLHGPKHAVVRDNRITNRNDVWLNNRGNGIHAWNNTGALIEGNTVEGGRDGIFIQLGADNRIIGNTFEHLRFAVHFMYSKQGTIADNISLGNHIGYALMYSDGLTVTGNVSMRDRDEGLALNTARKGTITGNYVYGNAGKCLFMYLSLRNLMTGNRFEGCAIGVHVTGSDENRISGNAFIDNQVQMRFAGVKLYEWSDQGRGNYWSDNAAFDLDSDGIADTAYRPNDVVDLIVWRYPLAKLLMSSPAMELLHAAQSQFPALYPGGVVDSYPLMTPPAAPKALPPVPGKIEWEAGSADPGS